MGYQYKYDAHNRLIEKKIPGKDWEYIVYDKLNRPVLTQDANLRAKNSWLFTKYDAFSRVVYTGTYGTIDNRAALQATLDAQTLFHEEKLDDAYNILDTVIYYSNRVFPYAANTMKVLTINYYDDYNFDTSSALATSTALVNETGIHVSEEGIVTKTSSAVSFNAGFNSQATIAANGGITYTLLQNDKRVMIGLTDVDNNPNYHYNTTDYAIYSGFGTDQRLYVYVDGSSVYASAVAFYDIGDTLSIERKGNQVLFIKNGVPFFVTTALSNATLVGDSSFCDPGAAVGRVMLYQIQAETPITGHTKGLSTGSKVRILDTNQWISTVSYYDDRARPIHIVSENEYLATNDAVSTWYDFIGNTTKTKTVHKRDTDAPITTIDTYSYTPQNALKEHKQCINGGPVVTIFENTYDDLGQLAIKKTGVQSHTGSQDLVNLVNVFQEDNYLTKVHSASWDGNIESLQQITGDGYLEFTVTALEKRNMIGLSDPSGELDHGYENIDYAIYTGHGTDQRVYIYEEGVGKTFSPAVYFEPGDVFRVERDGTTIRYKKNNLQFAETTVTTTPSLIADGSLVALGTYIKDVKLVDLNASAGQALQTIDYKNNVRGWLKEINDVDHLGDDLFAFKLNYNTPDEAATTALYNGNISETHWRSIKADGIHKYRYSYDELNRIQNGTYSYTGDASQNNRYNLNSVTYDKNGNIRNLSRNGLYKVTTEEIDKLVYRYAPHSNQLLEVSDSSLKLDGFSDGPSAGTDYTYDANGNMLSDANKDISSISYNHLNLPKSIHFLDGASITYTYDATGVKLRKQVNHALAGSNVTTIYAGNYVYKQVTSFGSLGPVVLEFFNHPEGYVEPPSTAGLPKGKKQQTKGGGMIDTSYKYFYIYKDHLGNNRLTYTDSDKDGTVDVVKQIGKMMTDVDGDFDYLDDIVETKAYYPFGLEHNYGVNSPMSIVNGRNHKWAFANKELEEDFGRNIVDYEWRDYDPARARFDNIDRFASKYDELTPYHFSANNPIYYREIKGDSIKVAEKYRKEFNKHLKNVFGDNASNFSYSAAGNLVFNGSKKDLSKEQKKVFKEFSKLLNEETTTNVIFETSYTVNEGSNSVTLNPSGSQGEATLVASENAGFNQNYVVVDTNGPTSVSVIEVTEEFFKRKSTPNPGPPDPNNPPFKPTTVQTNPTLTTFHGFGHVINGGQSQDKVIKFENSVIGAFNKVNNTNINERKEDTRHNKTEK